MEQIFFPRKLIEDLKKWIDRREIYAIKGPRQGGKTTLLKILREYLIKEKGVNPDNIIYLTLEDRDVLEKFSQDPKEMVRSFIRGKEGERFYFFIDEFHYLPDGGQKLKLLYDIFENVKFIVTGSSSLELTAKTSKFLVGRLFSFYLMQLSFEEFLNVKSSQLYNVYKEKSLLLKDFIFKKKVPSIKKDIFSSDLQKFFENYALFGGYPEVIKTEDFSTKKIILKNIYETYISREIIELLKITDFSKFRRLTALLANQIGNLINYNSLATDSQSYFREIKHYLSILEETFIIFLIRPFFTNKVTELKKNPKVYFLDGGLRNYIINNFNELPLRSDAGSLIENVILLQFKINFPDFEIKFWRTLAKAEVDFVLERGKEVIPVEVKYSTFLAPKVSRALRNFLNQYNPPIAVVLTQGFSAKLKINSTQVLFFPCWYV